MGWYPSVNPWDCSGEGRPHISRQDKHQGAGAAGCSRAALGTSALGRGKRLPRGGFGATDVPWRTRNEETEKQLQPLGEEARRSTKPETEQPGANVAALCQGLYFFCPGFVCPVAIRGTFSSQVVNLQVSWAFSLLNNLFSANMYFEEQPAHEEQFPSKNAEWFQDFETAKMESCCSGLLKSLMKHSNQIVSCYASESVYSIKKTNTALG